MNSAASTDTGRDFVQPVMTEDPLDAIRTMVTSLGVSRNEVLACDFATLDDPCVNITRHLETSGLDHVAHADVRLTPKSSIDDYDFSILITTHDPLVDGWVVENEWTHGDGDRPSWSW